jgi:hypothetical protein
MRKQCLALLLPTLFLSASAGSALAWSTNDAPSGPGMASKFSDPDDAVDNIANPSANNGGTQLTLGTGGTGSAHPVVSTPQPGDAEPVNPAWPLWMQWHQN